MYTHDGSWLRITLAGYFAQKMLLSNQASSAVQDYQDERQIEWCDEQQIEWCE